MRSYELLFVLDPGLSEEQKSVMVETVKGIINADG